MNYIISGLFNIFMIQFKELNIDIKKIFSEFETNISILENPIAKINIHIFGRYMEEVVRLKGNHRIGLESGFLIPFMLTGTFFNMYHRCKKVSELFENLETLDSTANNITSYKTKIEEDFLLYEISVIPEFTEKYPNASRLWHEMQYGIALQYAYSFTGRFLQPVSVHSIYNKENNDLLEKYFDCPVYYNQKKQVMVFNKSVLDLPVRTVKKELLPVFENVMDEIEHKQDENKLSRAVRRHLMHSLSTSDLNLKFVAERFNMSERNLQRKLKAESTSYQQILDNLRIEFSHKYLKEQISLAEISFLLGFESQSAFNKFFRKHFHTTPGHFK